MRHKAMPLRVPLIRRCGRSRRPHGRSARRAPGSTAPRSPGCRADAAGVEGPSARAGRATGRAWRRSADLLPGLGHPAARSRPAPRRPAPAPSSSIGAACRPSIGPSRSARQFDLSCFFGLDLGPRAVEGWLAPFPGGLLPALSLVRLA